MKGPTSLRRYLLAATWLVGTLIATAVVYEAVSAGAGQVELQRTEPISEAGIQGTLGRSTPIAASQSPIANPTAATSPTASASSASASNPPGPAGPPATPPSTGSSPNATRTFAVVGGTAAFNCTNGQISLQWATPNSGFQVDDIGSSDGGTQLEVRFRSDSHESRIQAWCAGSQVQGTTEEGSS